jgi:pyrroline-5-carboxylate reductase
MTNTAIAFIGAGNMARSLIGGLLEESREYRLSAADPDPAQRSRLADAFQIPVSDDNRTAADGADVVVLAVKPHIIKDACLDLRDQMAAQRPLVVSIAAGVRESDISRWLAYDAAVVRCMPNTPALVRSGASALYANGHVSDAQRDCAESLLRAVGVIVWVDEENALDAVTALSGSGPAYFFAIMEAMEAAAVALGLSGEQARLLTLETALGAAKMALEAGEAPAQLRANVTSKGGTTHAALEVFAQRGLAETFAQAMAAAQNRAREIGTQLGADE